MVAMSVADDSTAPPSLAEVCQLRSVCPAWAIRAFSGRPACPHQVPVSLWRVGKCRLSPISFRWCRPAVCLRAWPCRSARGTTVPVGASALHQRNVAGHAADGAIMGVVQTALCRNRSYSPSTPRRRGSAGPDDLSHGWRALGAGELPRPGLVGAVLRNGGVRRAACPALQRCPSWSHRR